MKYLFIGLVFIIFILIVFYNRNITEAFTSYADMYNAKGYTSTMNNTPYDYVPGSGSSANPESDYNINIYKDPSFHYNVNYDPTQDSGFLNQHKGSGTIAYTYDNNGNLVQVSGSGTKGNINYHEAGNYAFGPNDSSYKPVYDDSKFKNITTGETEFTKVKDTPSQLSGICANNANNPQQMEEACNALDKDVCASTSCCVLLGGTKCVSGDKTGPKFRYNYADSLLRNKDSYYYNGTCYGNCIKDAYNAPAPDIDVNITIDPSLCNATKTYSNPRFENTVPTPQNTTNPPAEDTYVTPTIIYAYEYNNTGNAGMGYDQTYGSGNGWTYNNWDGITANTFNNTGTQPLFGKTGSGTAPATYVGPQTYTTANNGAKVAINTDEKTVFPMAYDKLNNAVNALSQSTPDIPTATTNIQSAISVHTHNINQLKNSLFNLKYALKQLNGTTAISVSSALTSLSIASSSWGGTEIDFAISALSGPTPNIPYGISNINDAISKNNNILTVEQSALKSIQNALNEINTNSSDAVKQLNYALTILQNGTLSNNITPSG
jgi:hypothetical protein